MEKPYLMYGRNMMKLFFLVYTNGTLINKENAREISRIRKCYSCNFYRRFEKKQMKEEEKEF